MYIYTYIHTYIYTYIYICIYTYTLLSGLSARAFCQHDPVPCQLVCCCVN